MFLQAGSLSLAVLLADGCRPRKSYDVSFINDMPFGHSVIRNQDAKITNHLKTDYVIVGGGVAGLSAAYRLRDKKFLLFEVSNMLGGTSAGSTYRTTPLCHGAHYDLEYPENYGSEVLQVLEELAIVKYDTFSKSWNFIDRQYLIPKNKETQSLVNGRIRPDILPDGTQKKDFIELMKGFSGKMLLPTRLIHEDIRYLNDLSFSDWLKGQLSVNTEFMGGLDYHLKDDYGAGAAAVSALAGIHYFACRPYYTKPVELFSPPQGNYYFIEKILSRLPQAQIQTAHVVSKIEAKNKGLEVDVIDGNTLQTNRITCSKIVYAGNKHALKYIHTPDYSLFENNAYAPWVVVNLLLSESWPGKAFWQNEVLSDDTSFLGFVDSQSQYAPRQRVITAYYCFKPEEREMMSMIESKQHLFIERTVQHIETYFNRSIYQSIEKVFIRLMGHAMPIPKPGYLFSCSHEKRSHSNLLFAGVDTGRLPLLFEALDSGLMAADEVAHG
jgi:protoporphyrinogen oxidase